MSSLKNLSAGAASFVPGSGGGGGGGGNETHARNEMETQYVEYEAYGADEADEAIMDALDAELNKGDMNELVAGMSDATVSTSAGATAAKTSSSLPSHLANAAAEFWFPDCRDCACCKGYKHGCSCGGLCKCSGGGCGGSAAKPTTSLGAAAATSSTATTKAGKTQSTTSDNRGVPPPCKFFQMGSCRFGNKCRFSHA